MWDMVEVEDDKTRNAAKVPKWAIEKIQRDLEFKIGCDIAREGKWALARRGECYCLVNIKGVKPLSA